MQSRVGRRAESETDEFADERELVAGLRRDESTAHEEFVCRYGGRMLATARRFLGSEQDCHDAVQQAFVSALRSIDRFEGNAKLGTWLHRILVNVCLMTLRARSRRNEIPMDELLPVFDHSGHHARSIARWRQPPEDRLQSDETRQLVRRCIDMLPDEYRSVIILRDIEELDTAEAADTLGISPGAVKTRLHRARQALRTLLEPHFVR
jgi:RNA polymerase sigma-70 factor (ECF subfamily)